MDLNRATILGRLTRDPEMKSLPSGRSVTTFSVATGRQWTDQNGQKQKQTEFHNVVVWGKPAELASQFLRKASRVYIEGRIQTRDWVGQDGVKRYRTEIIVDSFILLDARPAGTGAAVSAPMAQAGEPVYQDIPPAPKDVVEEQIKVEDIPF